MERYFFNKTSSKCEEFIFGGCQGNWNNFPTESGCEDACGKPVGTREVVRKTVKTMNFEAGFGDWETSNISLVDISNPILGITPGASEGHMVAMAGNDKVTPSNITQST